MNWIPLETQDQIAHIDKSSTNPSIIFKHSTRCAISLMAKKRFEQEWDTLPQHTLIYFLDVLKFRSLSDYIAEHYHVTHQSPQLLLIKDAECIFEASHGEISAEEIIEQI